jgi:ATP-dependent Lhr-like helicase
VRRTPPAGVFYSVSTADPLNLAGIVTAGARVPARGRNRIAYRDGVPVAVIENQVFKALHPLDAGEAAEAARAMTRVVFAAALAAQGAPAAMRVTPREAQ